MVTTYSLLGYLSEHLHILVGSKWKHQSRTHEAQDTDTTERLHGSPFSELGESNERRHSNSRS